MENPRRAYFGWNFFQLNKIIDTSEALVKEDHSLKGVVFSFALAFLILIGTAQFLVMVENSLSRPPRASAMEETAIAQPKKNKESRPLKNPLLVWHKLLGVKTAQAQENLYQAKKLIQSHGSIILPAGAAMTFQVGFKNTGAATWYNSGEHYVSVYNRNKYTDSFSHKFWYSPLQPAKLQNSPVPPGQVGYFRFALQAPDIAGNYIAKFQLAAEDAAWIEGGELRFPFNAIAKSDKQTNTIDKNNKQSPPQTIFQADAPAQQTANDAQLARADIVADSAPTKQTNEKEDCSDLHITSDGSTCGPAGQTSEQFSAFKLIQSEDSPLAMTAGETREFRVGFKNNGAAVWTPRNIKLNGSPESRLSEEIKPGALGYFVFNLTAPSSSSGTHFELQTLDGQAIPGGELDLFITVSGQINLPSQNPAALNPSVLNKGPLIRVGLFKMEEPIKITANNNFYLTDELGNKLKTFKAGEMTTFSWQNGVYFYDEKSTSSYLRLATDNNETIFEILTLEERPSWNQTINYNRFRGSLEIRLGQRRGKVWVINELPLEDYLKGVAETSNYAPLEYLKAMTVAARSYAYYHYTYPNKHAEDFFTVDDTYDQVYRGYSFEEIMPKLSQAVQETNGEIVTYNGEAVVTPYYSRSDGRTRAWTEVWGGGAKPWLVSVTTPYDAGKTLWGHGVGLAATDALARARNGADYKTMLKYYYSGTEIEKIY